MSVPPSKSTDIERFFASRARGRREENEPEMMPPRTAEEYVSQQFRLRKTEAYSRSPAAIKEVVEQAKLNEKVAWITDLTKLLDVATKESQDAKSLLDDYVKDQKPLAGSKGVAIVDKALQYYLDIKYPEAVTTLVNYRKTKFPGAPPLPKEVVQALSRLISPPPNSGSSSRAGSQRRD